MAAFASRYMSELLHGTSVSDPRVYLVVTFVIVVASVVASWIPARRAARVDPITALRSA
jgi:ABC-type antimicrobial peptide transport system permease subunit